MSQRPDDLTGGARESSSAAAATGVGTALDRPHADGELLLLDDLEPDGRSLRPVVLRVDRDGANGVLA